MRAVSYASARQLGSGALDAFARPMKQLFPQLIVVKAGISLAFIGDGLFSTVNAELCEPVEADSVFKAAGQMGSGRANFRR